MTNFRVVPETRTINSCEVTWTNVNFKYSLYYRIKDSGDQYRFFQSVNDRTVNKLEVPNLNPATLHEFNMHVLNTVNNVEVKTSNEPTCWTKPAEPSITIVTGESTSNCLTTKF